MGEFRMPSLGADMDEGTLLEWLVQPGAAVHRGDIVAVVDTEKAAIEVECFEDGVIERLLVEPGTRVPVGAPLALIGGVAATAAAAAAAPAPVGAAAAPAPARVPVVPPQPVPAPEVHSPVVRRLARSRGIDLATVQGSGPGGAVTRADVEAVAIASAARSARAAPHPASGGRVRSSPRARRRAAELGIDIATVAGSGPGGAVTVADLERLAAAPVAPQPTPEAAPAPTPAPAPPAARAGATERAAAARRAVGELMARSKREIPHFYLTTTIDLSRATAWLAEQNRGRGVEDRLVPAALLLKAAAVATAAVPELNGWWTADGLQQFDSVNLGVAVALRGGGLIAPAIADAQALDLDTLMARLRDLVARARAGTLRQSQMTTPTITVTNLGDQGVDAVFGVIYPPQVALVGFGRVAERPWAQDGMLGVRPVVEATLSGDHRVCDGHRGGRYLTRIAELLDKPEEL